MKAKVKSLNLTLKENERKNGPHATAFARNS